MSHCFEIAINHALTEIIYKEVKTFVPTTKLKNVDRDITNYITFVMDSFDNTKHLDTKHAYRF